MGYTSKEITLNGEHNYDLKILLSADKEIEAVTIYSGKTSKNNPAIDILRKIWERKKKNGLRQFDQ